MIKCRCSKCGTEEVYEDHKAAWFAGWDLLGLTLQYCGDCSVMPVPTTKDKNDTLQSEKAAN